MARVEVILTVVLALAFLDLSSPIYEDRAFACQQADQLWRGSRQSTTTRFAVDHPPGRRVHFFAPAPLGLARRTLVLKVDEQAYVYEPVADVYSLCPSSGDADGLGETRKRGLQHALDFLGVRQDRRWVLDEPFDDNIIEFWDAKLIAQQVKPYIDENKIDILCVDSSSMTMTGPYL